MIWTPIEGFEGYEVSNLGGVRNAKTGHQLAVVYNQQGNAMVGLYSDGRQVKRQIDLLVAEAFLPEPEEGFNTVIHKDGDVGNNDEANLAWRPLWFRLKYHRQFRLNTRFQNSRYPVKCLDDHIVYENVEEAAIEHGLLFNDVIKSCVQGTGCFPGDIRFEDFDY